MGPIILNELLEDIHGLGRVPSQSFMYIVATEVWVVYGHARRVNGEPLETLEYQRRLLWSAV